MRVVICWMGMQGYVGACLRELARVPGVDLHVLHLNFEDLPFREELLDGVSNKCLMASEPNTNLADMVIAHKPDVVFLCGWFYQPYRRLIDRPELKSIPFVLGMDTSWAGSLAQRLNQLRLRRFMRRMNKVIVAGAKSAAYARRLGADPKAIVVGLYGFDFTAFQKAGEQQLDSGAPWPKRFLFAGRYVKEKGLDVLVDAYQRYRAAVADPWPLDCCGTGPEAGVLKTEGLRDLGYVQPSGLPQLFANHGVFVMPSREEPWGVAIAEAAATGLPLVCTDVCGAADDLLRPYYNGLSVPAENAEALAHALVWMHENHSELDNLGHRSRELARSFSAEAWAERVHRCFADVLDVPGSKESRG